MERYPMLTGRNILLPKVICRFNAISIKIPTAFLYKWTRSMKNSSGNVRDPDNQNYYGKEQSWRIHTPQFLNLLQSYNN